MESPWDEIAIQYVLVVNHCAKRRAIEAFKEECTLVSYVSGHLSLLLTTLSEVCITDYSFVTSFKTLAGPYPHCSLFSETFETSHST